MKFCLIYAFAGQKFESMTFEWVQTTYGIMIVDIWESYMCTADIRDPRSYEHYWKIRPENNSGPWGIWTHDLCDTGAALYQLSYYIISLCWVQINLPKIIQRNPKGRAAKFPDRGGEWTSTKAWESYFVAQFLTFFTSDRKFGASNN